MDGPIQWRCDCSTTQSFREFIVVGVCYLNQDYFYFEFETISQIDRLDAAQLMACALWIFVKKIGFNCLVLSYGSWYRVKMHRLSELTLVSLSQLNMAIFLCKTNSSQFLHSKPNLLWSIHLTYIIEKTLRNIEVYRWRRQSDNSTRKQPHRIY